METLLNPDALRARAHALPFRVMFEEARRCRPQRLHAAVARNLLRKDPTAVTEQQTDAQLLISLAAHEEAYEALEQNADLIARGNPDAPKAVDGLLRACADADRPLKNVLHAMEMSALCLSGGGIRSASFGLGLLEALARFSMNGGGADGVLNQVDYLSTVSGGGYIGSWLMAWVYRRWSAAGSPTCKASYQEVVSALAGQSDVTIGDPEPTTVRHLRSYTSYLAPALGLTLDTFTLAAIVLRNLLVNWIMLLPVLFTVAAFAQCSGYLIISVRDCLAHIGPCCCSGLTVVALFSVAAITAGAALPSHDRKDPTARWRKVCTATFLIAVPTGCWILCVLPVTSSAQNASWFFWPEIGWNFCTAILGYGILGVFMWLAYSKRVREMASMGAQEPGFWRDPRSVAILVLIAAATMSLLTSILVSLVQHEVFPALMHPDPKWKWLNANVGANGLFATFSLPLVIVVLSIGISLFCAVLGLFEPEEDREWWVRSGGVLLALSMTWLVVHGLLFFGPTIAHRLWIAAGGLLLGLGGSLAGYSGATSAGTRPVKSAELSSVGKFLQKHNLILPLAGGAAILLMSLGVMTVTQKLGVELEMALKGKVHFQWLTEMHQHGWRPELASGVVLLTAFSMLMVLANLVININLFSLHGMYRMRLMRAFLGASNVARRPDPFTRFDPQDTPLETDLPSEESVPLHVICTTLNLVGTRKTEWRQRRAESFTFSPVVAGGWRVGYVPANCYGGMRGVTLATALSISGAAFNPNMGYQSSPLLSLLMTFFNLRLGYWLPNPHRPTSKSGLGRSNSDFFRKSGPSFALKPLIQEALGQTDDTNRWIELTDGGHFDNLALYEMVMRRCKLIIVSDAGADPKYQFEDLGNALRKIQIDLGVPIVFTHQIKMKPGFKDSNKYCAVARIEYQWTDDPGPGQTTEDLVGYLIYIKPVLNGTEPMDVQQYAKVHNTFPHETTANQFFDEPQFESYRNLAYHELIKIATPKGAPEPVGSSLADFLKVVTDYAV